MSPVMWPRMRDDYEPGSANPGQSLVKSSSQDAWEPGAEPGGGGGGGGGASSLADLTDVDLTGAADGDTLVREGGQWVARNSTSVTLVESAGIVEIATDDSNARVAGVTPGKNLYDPTKRTDGFYLNHSNGQLVALAGYFTSDYIPVKAGVTYTISAARKLALFDQDKVYVSGLDLSQAGGPTTFTAAADGYARFSINTGSTGGAGPFQFEQGETPTAWEAYRVNLPADVMATVRSEIAETPSGPVTLTRTGNDITVTSTVDGKPLVISASLAYGRNGLFNFGNVVHEVTTVATLNDEVAPIRTQIGTVGANHGYPNVRAFTNPDGKTTADLGSVWTDGTRQYVLLAIDSAGELIFGGDYSTASGYVTSANVPSATLTHVSGATKTGAVSPTGSAGRQLEPSVGNVAVTLFADGVPITGDATVRARQVQVRESYEVLDYADLYDKAKANIGVPYTALNVAGCVMVENTFTFTANGRCRIDTAYTELTPTLLNNTLIFTQAVPMNGTVIRYMAGVKPIAGFDFTTGVDLAGYSATNYVTSADLLAAGVPPSFILDVRTVSGTPVLGFAHGYLPFTGADTDNAKRMSASGSRLWEIRNTKKSYPSAKMNTPPGWGRITGRSFRVYLSPAQVARVTPHRQALAAFAALDAAAALT